MNNTYLSENNAILKQILNDLFFNNWKDTDLSNIQHGLELQITDDCNLKCEYCYVHKYGDFLYPKSIRNHKQILNNLTLILNYFEKQNYHVPCLDLFSGEIWGNEFGLQILDLLLVSFKKYKLTNKIVIPSNMTFLLDQAYKDSIQNRIDKFKSIDVNLLFSASIDGLPLEDINRSFKDTSKNSLRNHSFYETVFEFCNKNHFGFHPMISAYSIEKWIDNYKWWISMFKKYDRNINGLMSIEVRNDDWTEDKIKSYLIFLDYIYNYKFNVLFKSNPAEFAKYVFRLDTDKNLSAFPNLLSIVYKEARYSCAVQKQLYVRLGDLKIVPCHRTSYPQFNYGKFEILNNEIIDISSENVELASKILLGNPTYTHDGCDSCTYNKLCTKGCLGSQYETSGFMFLPCKTVCDMTQAKADFLLNKFNSDGILHELFNTEYDNERNASAIRKVIKDYYISKGGMLNA